jgi:hypothetical protein
MVTPDSSRIATAAPDFESRGDLPNRVQIFVVEGDSLRQEFILDALREPYPRGTVFQWGPLHPRWLTNDTLEVDIFLRRSSWADSVGYEAKPLMITNRMGHWVVQ